MRATHRRKSRSQMLSNRPVLRGRRHTGGPVHRQGPSKHTKVFLPGQPVPETGIYEVVHDRGHRESHEAVMHHDDPFPACDPCNLRVRFNLVRTAPYIFDDEDVVEEK